VFKFYNSTGEQLKNIDWIEIQWNRKYTETGDFSLYTNVENWNTDIKYIKNVGRPETGIVQKLNYDKKENGTFVEVKGMFLESLLKTGINNFPNSYYPQNTPERPNDTKEFLEYLLQASIGTITGYDNLEYYTLYTAVLADDCEFPSTYNFSVDALSNIDVILRSLLIPLYYSYYCTPVFNPKTDGTEPLIGVKIHIYKLNDKTDSIYFGDYFQNVKDIQYTLDESAMYPRYYITQKIPYENAEQFTNWYWDYISGEKVAWITERYVDPDNKQSDMGDAYPAIGINTEISDIEMIGTNEYAIRSLMQQAGKLESLNHYKIETISADIIQNKFYYLTDYDLGDRCNLQITKLNQQFTARIAEINEVHSKNKVDISLTMGTPRKTTYIKKL